MLTLVADYFFRDCNAGSTSGCASRPSAVVPITHRGGDSRTRALAFSFGRSPLISVVTVMTGTHNGGVVLPTNTSTVASGIALRVSAPLAMPTT